MSQSITMMLYLFKMMKIQGTHAFTNLNAAIQMLAKNITWVCGTMCNHAVFHIASPDQEIKGINRLVYFYAELLKAWIIKLLWWFLYKAHSRSINNGTTIQSIKTHCDFVLYNIPALIRWAVSRLLGVVSSLRLDQFHPDQYSIQSQGLDPGKSKTDWLSTHSHTPVGARAILTTESKEQIISHSAIGLIKRSVWLYWIYCYRTEVQL